MNKKQNMLHIDSSFAYFEKIERNWLYLCYVMINERYHVKLVPLK